MAHAMPPEQLISETEITRRVDELAATISSDYEGREVFLVGVLKGAFIFLADLTRRLTIEHHVDFIALSSYPDSTNSSGAVRLIMDVRTDLEDRHVLVVEDIVDTGHTLSYLMKTLAARRPASLRSVALVRKPDRAEVDIEPDYLGFDIPDVWVVGYGLDLGDRHRTLPYIGKVESD
jgi:hypoxanthine phosphoribosyltransferase